VRIVLAQPSRSAEVLRSCVYQSHGASHEKRAFEIIFDQQAQRADLGGNESLPATISDTLVSFAVNRSAFQTGSGVRKLRASLTIRSYRMIIAGESRGDRDATSR